MRTDRYKSSLIPRRMPTCVRQGRRSRSEKNNTPPRKYTTHMYIKGYLYAHVCEARVCKLQGGLGVATHIDQRRGDPLQ